jgi:hypothetical protein
MAPEDRGESPSALSLATMAITAMPGGTIELSRETPELVSILVSHNNARLAARREEAWIEVIRHHEREVDCYSSRAATPL